MVLLPRCIPSPVDMMEEIPPPASSRAGMATSMEPRREETTSAPSFESPPAARSLSYILSPAGTTGPGRKPLLFKPATAIFMERHPQAGSMVWARYFARTSTAALLHSFPSTTPMVQLRPPPCSEARTGISMGRRLSEKTAALGAPYFEFPPMEYSRHFISFRWLAVYIMDKAIPVAAISMERLNTAGPLAKARFFRSAPMVL